MSLTLDHADIMAQDFVNTWARFFKVGHSADLSPGFMGAFEKANLYLNAKREAAQHRELNLLTEQTVAKEKAARDAFCDEYRSFVEKISNGHFCWAWACPDCKRLYALPYAAAPWRIGDAPPLRPEFDEQQTECCGRAHQITRENIQWDSVATLWPGK